MAFEKGQPRPEGAGRKKGVTNGDTAKLRELILGALDEVGGQSYLAQQAYENPNAFMGLIGKVLPKEINADITGESRLVVQLVRFGDDKTS
jgi:hypothetical protein